MRSNRRVAETRIKTNLKADLQVKLTSSGDDVLSGVGDPGLNTRVRLGESLETLDKLGKIVGVLDLDGDLDDWGNGELHDLHVVGLEKSGDPSKETRWMSILHVKREQGKKGSDERSPKR
jgi:hypothetical protein